MRHCWLCSYTRPGALLVWWGAPPPHPLAARPASRLRRHRVPPLGGPPAPACTAGEQTPPGDGRARVAAAVAAGRRLAPCADVNRHRRDSIHHDGAMMAPRRAGQLRDAPRPLVAPRHPSRRWALAANTQLSATPFVATGVGGPGALRLPRRGRTRPAAASPEDFFPSRALFRWHLDDTRTRQDPAVETGSRWTSIRGVRWGSRIHLYPFQALSYMYCVTSSCLVRHRRSRRSLRSGRRCAGKAAVVWQSEPDVPICKGQSFCILTALAMVFADARSPLPRASGCPGCVHGSRPHEVQVNFSARWSRRRRNGDCWDTFGVKYQSSPLTISFIGGHRLSQVAWWPQDEGSSWPSCDGSSSVRSNRHLIRNDRKWSTSRESPEQFGDLDGQWD